MAAGLSLEIVLRVPVAVVDDDGVGGDQVDAQASGFGAQQEDKSVEKKKNDWKFGFYFISLFPVFDEVITLATKWSPLSLQQATSKETTLLEKLLEINIA